MNMIRLLSCRRESTIFSKWFVCLFMVVALSCTFVSVPVYAVDELGVFELDNDMDGADAEDSNSLLVLPDDWETITEGDDSAITITNPSGAAPSNTRGIIQDDPGGSIFAGGGSKDEQPITSPSM